MIITGLVFAGVAALIHVDILFLESIAWTGKKARSVFGASREEAEVMALSATCFSPWRSLSAYCSSPWQPAWSFRREFGSVSDLSQLEAD